MIISRNWKLLLIICVSLALASCQTCRVTSVEDAKHYRSQGYEVRIAVYRVGLDGKLMGLGIWEYHAQAQAKVNGEWLWIDGNILSEKPTYTIDNDIWYWQPEIYEAVLKQNNAYN
jgi:hypothetical protein